MWTPSGIHYGLGPDFQGPGPCLSWASMVFWCSTMSTHKPVLALSPELSPPSLPSLLQAGPDPATTHSDSLITIDKWESTFLGLLLCTVTDAAPRDIDIFRSLGWGHQVDCAINPAFPKDTQRHRPPAGGH